MRMIYPGRVHLLQVKSFELLHPFEDGNGRVFVNLLLNRLLMQHNLGIATFYQPNIFDLQSVEEIMVKVKEAIENTNQLINGKTDLFDYTNTLSNEEKEFFIKVSNLFENKLNTQLNKLKSKLSPKSEEKSIPQESHTRKLSQ